MVIGDLFADLGLPPVKGITLELLPIPLVAVGTPTNSDIIRSPRPTSPVCSASKSIVEEPICRPEGPKEKTVPSIVTAEPPTAIVWPEIAKPVGTAVKGSPSIVKTDCAGFVIATAASLATRSLAPPDITEYTVPDKVIGEPPALMMPPLAGAIA